jgi:hypothetical protein
MFCFFENKKILIGFQQISGFQPPHLGIWLARNDIIKLFLAINHVSEFAAY